MTGSEWETGDQPQGSHAVRWAVFLGIAVIAGAFFLFERASFEEELDGAFAGMPPSASREPARVEIDFGNGTRRAFIGEVRGSMTMLSALRASQSAGGFRIETTDDGDVVSIAGVGGAKPWRAYLNGEPLEDPPGRVSIREGDRIEFRYE